MVDTNGNKVVKKVTAWMWGIIATVLSGVTIFIITTSLSGAHDDHDTINEAKNTGLRNKEEIDEVKQEIKLKLDKSVFDAEAENLKKSVQRLEDGQNIMRSDIKEILKTVKRNDN